MGVGRAFLFSPIAFHIHLNRTLSNISSHPSSLRATTCASNRMKSGRAFASSGDEATAGTGLAVPPALLLSAIFAGKVDFFGELSGVPLCERNPADDAMLGSCKSD